MVENSENYVKGLNWVSFWFKNYFITKVSDFILVVIFILFVVYSFLSKKNFTFKKNYLFNNKFIIIYGVIFSLFIFWFLKFPQLRYGGYALVFFVLVFFHVWSFYCSVDPF